MKLRLPRWLRRRHLCQPCKAGVHRHTLDEDCAVDPWCRCDADVSPPPPRIRDVQPRGDLL